MAITHTDRRRFFLATALTLLALPALWFVNQSENSTAPNVAIAGAGLGVDVGADHGDTAALPVVPNDTPTAQATAIEPVRLTSAKATAVHDGDIIGDAAPVFLGGPSSQIGAGLAQVAVPAPPAVRHISATATFRGNVGTNFCFVPGLVNGVQITVVNLDNGQSATCVTGTTQGRAGDQITLDTTLFSTLADLTSAPIPVEIRQ